MHDGILPAVNSGASVSRIGGSIQPKWLRKLGATAGGQLARYNEVKSYETMNTEITEETEREINRGKRILEFFNQPSGANYSPTEETILLHTVTAGYLDYMDMILVAQLKIELIECYHKHKDELSDLTAKAESKDTNDKDFSPVEQMLEMYMREYSSEAAKAFKDVYEKKKADHGGKGK